MESGDRNFQRYRPARHGDIELSYEITLHTSFEKKAATSFGPPQPPAGNEREAFSKHEAKRPADFIIDLEKNGRCKVETLDILCSRRHVSEESQSSAILYMRGFSKDTQPTQFRWM